MVLRHLGVDLAWEGEKDRQTRDRQPGSLVLFGQPAPAA